MRTSTLLGLFIITSVQAQFDRPEWQLVVPEKMVMTTAGLISPIQPLLINSAGELSLLDLGVYLPFEIPDSTAIQAISFRESDDAEVIILLSFSTAVANFSSGDLISCQSQVCQVLFNPQIDLGLDDVVQVDAFSSVDAFSIHLSFNVGFTYNNQFIDPNWLYSIGTLSSGELILAAQTDTAGIGFNETTSFNAFDRNRDDEGISRFFGGDSSFINSNGELIDTSQLLAFINGNEILSLPYDLPDGLADVTAFSSLNSGRAGFAVALADVQESAGDLMVEVTRTQGAEGFLQVLVDAFDISAQQHVDYLFNQQVLTWLDGETDTKLITIELIDNQQLDGTLFFELTLTANSEFSTTELFQSSLTVTVLDDEANDLIFKDGFD